MKFQQQAARRRAPLRRLSDRKWPSKQEPENNPLSQSFDRFMREWIGKKIVPLAMPPLESQGMEM